MQEINTTNMKNYVCSVCSFIYDEESAERSPEDKIIPFNQLDDDWTCPNCGVTWDLFREETSAQ